MSMESPYTWKPNMHVWIVLNYTYTRVDLIEH